jgi:hypothetical protein
MDEHPDISRVYADLTALRTELISQGVMTAVLDQRLKAVEEDIRHIETGEDKFVLKTQFEPYRQIIAGTVLLLIGGLITLGFTLLGGG